MRLSLTWLAVPLLLLSAAMLAVDVGASGLWLAVIALGIGMVAVGQAHPHHPTV
jgi:hypothetical protein